MEIEKRKSRKDTSIDKSFSEDIEKIKVPVIHQFFSNKFITQTEQKFNAIIEKISKNFEDHIHFLQIKHL
jgi:hypothetical protein